MASQARSKQASVEEDDCCNEPGRLHSLSPCLPRRGKPRWPKFNLNDTYEGDTKLPLLHLILLCNCRHAMCVKWLLEQGRKPAGCHQEKKGKWPASGCCRTCQSLSDTPQQHHLHKYHRRPPAAEECPNRGHQRVIQVRAHTRYRQVPECDGICQRCRSFSTSSPPFCNAARWACLFSRLQIPDLSRWIDSQTTGGLTALHVAVQHDALECVLALIEAGSIPHGSHLAQ